MTDEFSQEIKANWPFREAPPRRIVVKAGSNILSHPEGGVNEERIASLCASMASLKHKRAEVIFVTSGAVSAGLGLLGIRDRPKDIPRLQAVAAIGQGALMSRYIQEFQRHGIVAAQVLLTHDDMEDRRRYLNSRNAFSALLDHGAIPIVNENDTTTVDELKFGDNDFLSAILAVKMEADLLVILSNVGGLLRIDSETGDSELVPVVERIDGGIFDLAHSVRSRHGTGGMQSKLRAAQHATQFGVAAAFADGTKPGKLDRIFAGEFTGTLFLPSGERRAGSARKHWIVTHRPRGTLVVDAGAREAVLRRKSLLSVGIERVEGRFVQGDVVGVTTRDGNNFAIGIVNYSADQVDRLKGRRADQMSKDLGGFATEVIIHTDNMVLLEE